MHTVQICCVLLWGDIDWFTYILQLQFAGIGIIIWLPQCQWISAEEYGQTDHMNILRTDINTTIKQYTKQCAYFMGDTVINQTDSNLEQNQHFM